MNPVEIIKDNLSIIKHVHIKDCSDTFGWKKMGVGDVDFPAIAETLYNFNYTGWIMVEEETDEAAQDPHHVIIDIGKYVQTQLEPITRNEVSNL
ncbi:sugar phosphate isomerase/epimerase family protein [Bacillus sp. N9]